MNYDGSDPRAPRWLLAGLFACCASFAALCVYGPSGVRWLIQVLT